MTSDTLANAVRLPRFRLLGPVGRFWIAFAVYVGMSVVVYAYQHLFHVSEQTFGTVAEYAAQNLAFLVYLVLVYVLFRFEPAARIRARAQAAGRRGRLRTFWSILFCLLLAILQLYTAVVDVPQASETAPEAPRLAVAMTSVNVLLSWLVVHAVYAEFYATKFYREGGGLNFPGTPAPAYRDFAYFAFSVGMTFGTTDVEVTSSGFRHVMLPHKLISFAFNTAILALVFSVMFK
jgi:uncharacterized membrane protein